MKKLCAVFFAAAMLLASGCEKDNADSVPLPAEQTGTQVSETSGVSEAEQSETVNAAKKEFAVYTDEMQIYEAGAEMLSYREEGSHTNLIEKIHGHYCTFDILNAEDALRSVEQIKNFIGCKSPAEEFEVEEFKSGDGTIYNLRQIYRGIPYDPNNGVRIYVDENGKAESLVSSYLAGADEVSDEPLISEEEVYEIVKNADDVVEIYDVMGLYVTDRDFEPVLAWAVDVKAMMNNWSDNTYEIVYCVDADTGEIFKQVPIAID